MAQLISNMKRLNSICKSSGKKIVLSKEGFIKGFSGGPFVPAKRRKARKK